jgi:hypothetical protein
VAGFISEWWPESNRNGGRHQIGIPGRIASEFAPVDLIAWTPRLNCTASWLGRVALLGEDELLAPRLDDEQALMVHETPLAWLIAGRQGVVIVDPRKAAPILREAEPLKTHSIAFSRRILTLATLRTPRVFAPSAKLRAVA